MKAVVLAAGKGERLWPLTENRPKPMIPVANKPILEHIIEALATADVTEVLLVVGANRHRVQSYFEDGAQWDLDITYVVQDQQLGTGHALLQAESHIGGSFLALNGDRIIEPSLIDAVRSTHDATAAPVVSVTSVDTPSEYGVVELDGKQLDRIDEQPPAALAKSDLINAGVYAFTPSIFAAIRQTDQVGEQALTATLTELLEDHAIHAVRYQGTWLDVTVPWDLLTMNAALLDYGRQPSSDAGSVADAAVVADNTVFGEGVVVQPQASVLPGVTLGDNVHVSPNAFLENSITLPDTAIKPGAVVTDCIVGANTTVGPNTTIEGGPATATVNGTIHDAVPFGALIGDNVEIGANVTIHPGTIIGNNAHIESGAVVAGQIDDGSHVIRG